jgi:hypothetical protein
MDTLTIVLIVVAVVAVAFAVYMYMQRERTTRLKKKYGPEYERLAAESGGRTSVESQLLKREERVKKYQIRRLDRGERDQFAASWRAAQARFVDDPRMAIAEADELVCRVMEARGYPMADFDRRAEDVSVDHPQVVDHYRAAHDVAVRDKKQPVDTEDLRRAMIHYRALFEDLLETNVTRPEEVHHR